MNIKERRRYPRHEATHPIKLRCMKTGKYLVGKIRDISAGGALVIVDRPSLLVGGQRISAGIAWNSQTAVICTDQLIESTVVRSLGLGKIQHVALQFDKAQPIDVFECANSAG